MTRPQPCDSLMNMDVGLLAMTSAVVLMFRLLVTVPVPERTLRVLSRVVPLLFTVAHAVLNDIVVQSGSEHVYMTRSANFVRPVKPVVYYAVPQSVRELLILIRTVPLPTTVILPRQY